MSKVFMFEETGEVRIPKKGEWFINGYGEPELMIKDYDQYAGLSKILRLTEYLFNPLEEVKNYLESVLYLVAEGSKHHRTLTIHKAIEREVLKAIAVVEDKQ